MCVYSADLDQELLSEPMRRVSAICKGILRGGKYDVVVDRTESVIRLFAILGVLVEMMRNACFRGDLQGLRKYM